MTSKFLNVKGKICAFCYCFSFCIFEFREKGKVLSRIEKIFEYLFSTFILFLFIKYYRNR